MIERTMNANLDSSHWMSGTLISNPDMTTHIILSYFKGPVWNFLVNKPILVAVRITWMPLGNLSGQP